MIDGVDISKIGLDALRKGLALCPQGESVFYWSNVPSVLLNVFLCSLHPLLTDAVIFDAKLRENLSPDGEATDQQMYSALRAVGLITIEEASGTITPAGDDQGKTRFHLDADCREDSFSAGQRQLLGLARALIKHSKIMILDEATAATDLESDSTIQQMIQSLAGCSLLSIAHRLDTIAFYDRVLVMSDGKVAEYDTPLALFDKENSIFRSMW